MAFTANSFKILSKTNGYTVWQYSTEDLAADTLKVDYFSQTGISLLKGDMIIAEAGKAYDLQMILLMVTDVYVTTVNNVEETCIVVVNLTIPELFTIN